MAACVGSALGSADVPLASGSLVVAPKPLGGVGDPDQGKSRQPVPAIVGDRSPQVQLPDNFDAIAGQHPGSDAFKRTQSHPEKIASRIS